MHRLNGLVRFQHFKKKESEREREHESKKRVTG
jgi:hypothetical protein